jgi:hypothetical protein
MNPASRRMAQIVAEHPGGARFQAPFKIGDNGKKLLYMWPLPARARLTQGVDAEGLGRRRVMTMPGKNGESVS